MATELGKAYVQVIPSAKGIGGMLKKSMGGDMDSAGNEYMENVTSFSAAMISSLGGNTKKAAKLSN